MRFCSLGSGSTGNASLIEASDGGRTSRILLDCGFSQRELIARLARVGIGIEQVDAIFITHEHGDHVGCAIPLSRRYRIPLWMSRGTWRAVNHQPPLAESLFDEPDPTGLQGQDVAEYPSVRFASDSETIEFPGVRLLPYTVPHDAREPLQAIFCNGQARFGVLTDAGCATPHLIDHLTGCHGLLLECNHDSSMLAASAYPASLKARISGRLGHLSNGAAAAILSAVAHAGLRRVVAAHLSERNNTSELARNALAEVLGARPEEIQVADPKQGTPWVDLA